MGSIAEVSAVQNNFTRYTQTPIKHWISKAKKKKGAYKAISHPDPQFSQDNHPCPT